MSELARSFGGQDVLQGVSFQLTPGERAGLVGANGGGKSTLLRIIVGELEPDAGQVMLAPGTTLAYLPQDVRPASGQTLQAELLSVFTPIQAVEAEQRALEAEMDGRASDDARLIVAIERHAALHVEFERLGGYTVEAEIGQVMAGLGFTPADGRRPVAHFSGGWQMRIALAKLLLHHPDLLLLDEPTNHLDLAAIEWLEAYLARARGALLVVSHDRYFLDRVTTRTIELEQGRIAEYAGNYRHYLAERDRRQATQQAAYERQQAYLAEQQAFVERFRADARRSTQAKSREKQLAKIEQVEPPRRSRHVAFRFPPCNPSGREVFVLKGLAKAYGARPVLAGCDLKVEQGERIGLVGPNGAGKSTLLRLLAGLERPDRGSLRLGHNLEIAYFAQHQAEALDPARTVLDEVYRSSPPSWSVGEVRDLLARFLFRQDEVFKPIAVLSGGERSRVALAKMLLRPANVLLLDEPNNHLDVPAREVLETALRAYPGTALIASHDRYLLDQVATRIVEVRDGHLCSFLSRANGKGDPTGRAYTSYREQVLAEEVAAAAAPPAGRAAEPPKQAPEPRRPASAARALAVIEEAIGAAEAELARLEAALADPELYRDGGRVRSAVEAHRAAQTRLSELEEQWEALMSDRC